MGHLRLETDCSGTHALPTAVAQRLQRLKRLKRLPWHFITMQGRVQASIGWHSCAR